ncbi:MAG: FAD-dependent oxidoreductase, partial [Actinobacteria bacterium]|nr:FAD-dependent oxidoreductase [Actinomycetota bacterium]
MQPALPSWWLEQALAAEGSPEPAPPLRGDARADVVVVGGGYTGLWTALELKVREPSLGVTVLEAEICGHGPSGRNGGFIHGYWDHLRSLLGVLGREEALALCAAGERIVPGVRAFCEEHGEDVWLREGGRLVVSTVPEQDGVVERAVAAAREVGRPEEAVELSREELAARVRSPVFRRGVFFRDGATVHPGLLVRALRRAALAAGVTLHEGTPVRRVRNGEVLTADGAVRAPEIVLAMNAALTGWKPAGRSLTNFG